MNNKLIHKIIGGIVFLIALVAYFMTVQPSVSFWDCGELAAASYGLEVTHPPGAPFFMLMNRLFTLIPFADNIGFRINTVTVIASSFSVLFLYLVAVRLINNYKKDPADSLFTYISAAIGALSMCFATAFWFNSTESNVFGFSCFLFTLMIWVMMVWYEHADEPGSDRYILFIAFVLGLSPGVHLMSVLAAVPVGMLYVMKRYFVNDDHAKYTAKLFAGHVLLLVAIALVMWSQQTSSTPPSMEEYKQYDTKFKLIVLFVSAIAMGIFWKKVFNRNSFYIPFIVGMVFNFVIYPGIVKYLPNLMTSIGSDSLFVNAVVLGALLCVLGYTAYWAQQNKKQIAYLLSLSLLFAIVGFTVYSYIIIRANQRPPMNENDPKDIKSLVSYLSREQYGDFPTFKRRYSPEPQHRVTWENYTSDLDFFWRWQMNHMYVRYLLWEYVGRGSWDQDAGVKFSQLYGIPFIIGMIGLFYHFRRDWRMASLFFTLFVLMGFLICFYQNQQQSQPRDREYFYAGSWFVFSIWIAIGLSNILDDIKKFITSPGAAKGISYTVLVAAFVLIPFNMFRTNYHTEDRSKNWVPWDYAYNMLQSCAPNAILFTCGDNDTFPLWYIQDVEGVRRDVRIANLSLINTDWYIKQLKNDTPYGSQKVAMTYTSDQITKLEPVAFNAQNVDIPVPQSVFKEFGVSDSSAIARGKITFKMSPTLGSGNNKGIRVQDMMVKDIILSNNWQRPIYFASTCDESNKIGLDQYLRLEGLTQRLTPIRSESYENVDVQLATKNLLSENVTISKTPQSGFNYRSFNDKSVFLDENQVRITYNYRESFISLATYFMNEKNDKENCLKTLRFLDEKFPRDHFAIDYRLLFGEANLYFAAGDFATFKTIAYEYIPEAEKRMLANPRDVNSYYNPYSILKLTYENLGEYDKEIEVLKRLQTVAGNGMDIQNEIARIQKLKDSVSNKK